MINYVIPILSIYLSSNFYLYCIFPVMCFSFLIIIIKTIFYIVGVR